MSKKLILPENVVEAIQAEGSNVKPFERPPIIQPAGKEPTGSDWLSGLDKGAVFLAHPKDGKKHVNLCEYHVVYQLTKSTLLLARVPGGEEYYLYVIPENFCSMWELYELVNDGQDADTTIDEQSADIADESK